MIKKKHGKTKQTQISVIIQFSVDVVRAHGYLSSTTMNSHEHNSILFEYLQKNVWSCGLVAGYQSIVFIENELKLVGFFSAASIKRVIVFDEFTRLMLRQRNFSTSLRRQTDTEWQRRKGLQKYIFFLNIIIGRKILSYQQTAIGLTRSKSRLNVLIWLCDRWRN